MKDKDILSKVKDILTTEEEVKQLFSKQTKLSPQSFKTLEDINSINPLTKEIISRQATRSCNIRNPNNKT